MKIESTRKVGLEEIKSELLSEPHIRALFKNEGLTVTFRSLSYTSDQDRKPKFGPKTDFVTIGGVDINDERVTKEITLTVGEVQDRISKKLKLEKAVASKMFDCRSTGDGDGSTVHEMIGFSFVTAAPAP